MRRSHWSKTHASYIPRSNRPVTCSCPRWLLGTWMSGRLWGCMQTPKVRESWWLHWWVWEDYGIGAPLNLARWSFVTKHVMLADDNRSATCFDGESSPWNYETCIWMQIIDDALSWTNTNLAIDPTCNYLFMYIFSNAKQINETGQGNFWMCIQRSACTWFYETQGLGGWPLTYLKLGGKLCVGESVVSLLASNLRYSRLSRPRKAKACTSVRPQPLRSRWTSSWRPRKASSPTEEMGFDLKERRIRYLQSATAALGTALSALLLRSRSTRLVRPLGNNIDSFHHPGYLSLFTIIIKMMGFSQ